MKSSKNHYSLNNPFFKMDTFISLLPKSAGNATNCPYLPREASKEKKEGLEVATKLSKIHFSLNNPF